MQLATSFTKELAVALQPDEIQDRARMLARTIEEIADVEQEAKKIASQFGTKLKGLRQSATALAHTVSSGEEKRPALCSERADMRRFAIDTYRHDNGEVVETRVMTQDEVEEARQTNLFGGVRVATDAKPKSNLDVEAPAANDAAPPEAPADGETAEADANDDTAITDPDAVIAGKKPKRVKKPKGLNAVIGNDPSPIPEPAAGSLNVSDAPANGTHPLDPTLERIEKADAEAPAPPAAEAAEEEAIENATEEDFR